MNRVYLVISCTRRRGKSGWRQVRRDPRRKVVGWYLYSTVEPDSAASSAICIACIVLCFFGLFFLERRISFTFICVMNLIPRQMRNKFKCPFGSQHPFLTQIFTLTCSNLNLFILNSNYRTSRIIDIDSFGGREMSRGPGERRSGWWGGCKVRGGGWGEKISCIAGWERDRIAVGCWTVDTPSRYSGERGWRLVSGDVRSYWLANRGRTRERDKAEKYGGHPCTAAESIEKHCVRPELHLQHISFYSPFLRIYHAEFTISKNLST